MRYDHHHENGLDGSRGRRIRTSRPRRPRVALGGLLFGGGRGPSAVAGAVGGAAVGAAASQGSAEQRTYQIVVRFDDGGYGEFVYAGYSPFRPGERVAVTPGGLSRTA